VICVCVRERHESLVVVVIQSLFPFPSPFSSQGLSCGQRVMEVLKRHPSSIPKTILTTRILLQNRCTTTSTSSLPVMMRLHSSRSIHPPHARNSRIHAPRAGPTRSPTTTLILVFLSQLTQTSSLISRARGTDGFAARANGYREALDGA
jgi:hypothetical protein